MAQLKTYYYDYNGEVPDSAFMYELLGLNLLCLLSQNQIAEFHTELELLDPQLLQDNVYIRHPVGLEQFLMEGAYNKVILSRGNVPADTYLFFVEKLIGTIRDEIADCCEKAYTDLPKLDASKLMFFDTPDSLDAFAETRGTISPWAIVRSLEDSFW